VDNTAASYSRVYRLEQFLEASAALMPANIALVCDEERVTFEQLEKDSNRLAHALRSYGVKHGDRVAIWLDNRIETVVSVFGVLKAGAAFVLLGNRQKPAKVSYILNNCQAVALICSAGSWKELEDVDALPCLRNLCLVDGQLVGQSVRSVWQWRENASFPCDVPGKRTIDLDLAALIYTSGSTGKPKGVMLSHLNMISAASSITSYLGSRPSDVVLSALPLSFDYGLYQVLMAAKAGASVILQRSFAYPTEYIQTATREHATGLPLLPTMIAMLLQCDLSQYDWSSLRYITSTGAPLPASHIQALRSALPHVRIYSMYGLTECKRVSFLPPEQIDSRPASVGCGMPNEDVFIVDEQGCPVPHGQIGELAVRGSHVMLGYWGLPEETAKVLRPGVLPGDRILFTGDLFRSDSDGYLYYVSRKDDMIKSRGFKVSPREIEDVLYQMNGVTEAVAHGIPHELFGQVVKVTVACNPGVALAGDAVIAHCRKYLEDFMVPSVVDIVKEIPKTSSGKLMRSGAPQSNVVPTKSQSSPFSRALLTINVPREVEDITRGLGAAVFKTLRRRGAVVALSGGIDSSVVAALCVRALGPERVRGLVLPEKECPHEAEQLARLVAAKLGVTTETIDITDTLACAGCYGLRDAAIQVVIPGYAVGWSSKIVLSDCIRGDQSPFFVLVARSPDGREVRVRPSHEAYLQIVAATNFKQRTRKMMEYYCADRHKYAVVGTPNRLEYDQGFFVKNGDGAADIKPIAHLYKSQVIDIGRYLDLPELILNRPPATDTFSLFQSQEEFYFGLPLATFDLILFGLDRGVSCALVAEATGMTAEQITRVYEIIELNRRAALYRRAEPVLHKRILGKDPHNGK
jgi:amino acid adenylation domain-containing protein